MQASPGQREDYVLVKLARISQTVCYVNYAPKGINQGRNLRHDSEERQAFGSSLVAKNLGRVERLPMLIKVIKLNPSTKKNRTYIGVQPKEKTTMNRYMKLIPALALVALPKELSRPVTIANITVMMDVDVSNILRRPKLSITAEP
jgi:hypothetical protein